MLPSTRGSIVRRSSLQRLEGPCLVPGRVYHDVGTRGLEEGYPDARRGERAVEDGTLEVVGVERTDTLDRLRENPNPSEVDSETT